ncbi:SIR2 family protein [Gordonia rhizosphera]|uniref:Uncharacterized protein n=1 Tax=Gordonia rhizosphera NBRC 16068 TaxID=1108045 RepID=K6WCS4_9ACTN|nr:SIR2 family protein [Gordonia rhizosphera]GAB91541.1 hypothetical protein GORHZ_136_00040 [Gordonia rhizosphera NBRC 16068]
MNDTHEPGHLFVLHGRIENLDVDAVIIPTDSDFRVEPHWHPITGDPRQAKPDGWGWELGFGQSRADDAVWFLSVFDDDAVEGEHLGKRVQRTVRAIVMAGLTAAESRAVPRIAIPVLGIGYGGQGAHRGRVLDTLLHALLHSVGQHGVDIVLVTPDRSVFSAAQHRRRSMSDMGATPLPWVLPDDALDEARRLGRLARDGHLALFLGAGVSMAAGLPSWDQLLQMIADRAGVDLEPMKKLGSLDTAELLKHAVEPQVLGEVVAEILGTPTKISLAHGLLAGLGAHEAISTNYDGLVELAVSQTGHRAPSVLPWEPVEVGRPWLLKLHGDLRKPESIVLTRRDFVLFDARSRPAGSLLQATLMTKHLLIVGASLADDNVIRLAMEVDEYLRTNGTEARQGTFIDVSGHAARQQLWTRQFDWFICAGAETKDRVRQMEIFLDVVAAYAATDASWLLDDRFAGLLSRDERRIVERVRDALDEVPSGANGLLAPLESIREALGGRAE